MSRIGRQRETLAQVVDRLEGAVAQLTQLAESLDLSAGVTRPYAPVTPEAARTHGATLALALDGDDLRLAIVDRYDHDPALLVAALDGAGLVGWSSPEPAVERADAAARLRALRSELRAS